MIKKVSLGFCCLIVIVETFAQVDFRGQYFNGKSFYREGKYNLAMESFKQVIPYDQNNPFSEYASFYYALSAYHQGYMAVAKDMLNQIKNLYPRWNKLDEVNFWLAKIYMDNRDYFQGMRILEAIKNPQLQKDIRNLKSSYLAKIEDPETLKMMAEEYPNDAEVAKPLAFVLSKNPANEEDRIQLEKIIEKFRFKKADFVPEAPPTFFKDAYSISVLLPFMVKTLEPTASRKRNQIILDLYEGMKLAADTLQKQGIKISLRAYDTERDTEKIKKLLETEELKNTDLIIGPFFQEENKIIQDFSLNNQINLLNPLSTGSETIGQNPYGFLLQPSNETIGLKSAEFLSEYIKDKLNKKCMVFYGTSRKDSVTAANFVQKAQEGGLSIITSLRVPKEDTRQIINILATPTEYDQWKNPIEFTLKKDSIAAIFVASDDPLIYSKVINSMETRGDSVVLVGSENWLDNTSIELEKYQRLGIVLAAPNFTSNENPHYRAFVSKFVRVHGRKPNEFSELGYETILFAGHSLNKYGVYFQDSFNKEARLPGYLSEGYSYQLSRSNQLIPFIKFIKGELIAVKTK